MISMVLFMMIISHDFSFVLRELIRADLFCIITREVLDTRAWEIEQEQ